NRRNMHDDRSRSRHYRQDMPDYGLWGDRIHRPSSGFSYSDAEAYDFEQTMNPNVRYVPDEPNRDTSGAWADWRRHNYNFQRRANDTMISQFVHDVLARHPDIDVSQVGISTQDRVVTLEGQVETRRMKRLIEDVIFGLPQIRDVQNRIEILPADRDRRRMARSLS
ncbi:MAG: BON domain-containing protein, partial [Pseudobdellovibrionaceae bacterium]